MKTAGMRGLSISFPTVEAVSEFVHLVEANNIVGELRIGSYSLDPGSIMGILSVELKSVFSFLVYNENEQIVEKVFDKFIAC